MATDYSKNGGMRSLAFNDGSMLTCLGNDLGYENVFAKQIDDLLIWPVVDEDSYVGATEQHDAVVRRNGDRRKTAQQLNAVRLRRMRIVFDAVGPAVDLLRLVAARADDLDHPGLIVSRLGLNDGWRIGCEHETPGCVGPEFIRAAIEC